MLCTVHTHDDHQELYEIWTLLRQYIVFCEMRKPLHSTNSAGLPVGPSFVYLARIKKQPGKLHQIVLVQLYTSISISTFNWPLKETSVRHTIHMIENIELMTSSKIVSFQKHTTLANMKLKQLQPEEAFFIQKPWCMKTINASRSKRSRTKMNLGISRYYNMILQSQDIRRRFFPLSQLLENTHETCSLHLAIKRKTSITSWRLKGYPSDASFGLCRTWWIPCSDPAAEHVTQSFSLNWEANRIQQKAKCSEEQQTTLREVSRSWVP